jgi:hypothetical protein
MGGEAVAYAVTCENMPPADLWLDSLSRLSRGLGLWWRSRCDPAGQRRLTAGSRKGRLVFAALFLGDSSATTGRVPGRSRTRNCQLRELGGCSRAGSGPRRAPVRGAASTHARGSDSAMRTPGQRSKLLCSVVTVVPPTCATSSSTNGSPWRRLLLAAGRGGLRCSVVPGSPLRTLHIGRSVARGGSISNDPAVPAGTGEQCHA